MFATAEAWNQSAQTGNFDQFNQVVSSTHAGAIQSGLIPKPDKGTKLEQLIAARDALDPNDPQRATFDAAIEKESKAHPPNITVNTAENSFGKEFGKQNAKQFFERRQVALDAANSLRSISETRQLLEGGFPPDRS